MRPRDQIDSVEVGGRGRAKWRKQATRIEVCREREREREREQREKKEEEEEEAPEEKKSKRGFFWRGGGVLAQKRSKAGKEALPESPLFRA